ncbi:ribonuclease P [Candidatus Woesearchaeota archaeon]|nr:ribonuclease P [Candidatus Woesearchaeota archaeon]
MKKREFSKKQKQAKESAKKRIIFFFKEAKNVFASNPSLANRYITLARKYSMKYKVKIPRVLKRRFCRHCYKYLVPGKNCRVRTHKGKVVYFCMNCKKYMRFVY